MQEGFSRASVGVRFGVWAENWGAVGPACRRDEDAFRRGMRW